MSEQYQIPEGTSLSFSCNTIPREEFSLCGIPATGMG